MTTRVDDGGSPVEHFLLLLSSDALILEEEIEEGRLNDNAV